VPELAFILVAILVIWSVLARAAVFKLMHYPGGVNVLLDLLAPLCGLPAPGFPRSAKRFRSFHRRIVAVFFSGPKNRKLRAALRDERNRGLHRLRRRQPATPTGRRLLRTRLAL
jgi:hypothetical protein